MNPKLKKLIGRLAMIMTAGLIVVTPALAVEYVDIDQSVWDGWWLSSNSVYHQTFIPSADNITAVSLYFQTYVTNLPVQILDDVCGTVIAHGTGRGAGWVKFDLVGAQALVPGNVYAIRIDLGMTSGAPGVTYSDPYPDGMMVTTCLYPQADRDLRFRTWADLQAVPTVQSTWSAVKSLYR